MLGMPRGIESTKAVGALVIKMIRLSQTLLQRFEVAHGVDRASRFFTNSSQLLGDSGPVPGMEYAGRNSWKAWMTDGKRRAKLNRVADHFESSVEQVNCRCLAGIEVLPARFPESDLLAEISFVKRHEVGMNVPSVSIRLVESAENAAG